MSTAQEVAQDLLRRIRSAGLMPGAALESDDEVARRYDVSKDVARRAWMHLVKDGVVERRHGLGTFVAAGSPRLTLGERVARLEARPGRLQRSESDQGKVVDGERGFRVAMREAGKDPWDQTTFIGDVEALGEAAAWLGVPIGTPVLQRARVHGIRESGVEIPVMISWTWILPAVTQLLPILREEDTGEGGMSSRFQDLGLRLHWEVVATARAAGEVESGRLGMASGAPVMDAWRRCFDQDDRVLEVTRRVIDPANYDLVFRFGG